MSNLKLTLSMAILGVSAIAMLGASAAAGGYGAAFGFSARTIKGTYASTFQGSVINGSSLEPINGTAVLNSDGKGNITGKESFVFNGTICTNVSSKGTYTVNADGSGTTSFVFTGGSPACSGSYTQSLAIGESGKIVLLNNTNTANQISETWRLQNTSPF